MKDKKIAIAVMAFAIVLLLTIASTYAYFTATATTDTTAETVNVKTAELGITYAHGNKVNFAGSQNLHSDWRGIIPIIVTNNGTLYQSFDVSWDEVTTNEIVGYANTTTGVACTWGENNCSDVRDDFSVSVFELNDTVNMDNITINDVDYNYKMQYLTLNGATNDADNDFLYNAKSNNTIVPSIIIAPGETKKLAIDVFFDYTENYGNQNYQQGKEFEGTIQINNVEMPEIVMGSTDDWQINSEVGEITAFIGDMDNCDNIVVTPNHWTNNILTENFKSATGKTTIAQLTSNKAYDITIPNVITDGTNYYNVQFTSSGLFLGTNNEDNQKIKSIKISDGIRAVIDATFLDNYSNSSLIMPDSLIVIRDSVFSNNSISGVINFPKYMNFIYDDAFSNNTNITGIVFDDYITRLGDSSFSNCNITGDVSIPVSMVTIGTNVFYGNSNLTSIDFENRTSLDGINLSYNWNLKSTGEYFTYTCSGTTCED